jgi:hypothetical protein
MTAAGKYPPEWLERLPAEVFACLVPGELRITLCPGGGMGDGRAQMDIPIARVPFELRMPKTPLWVQLDENWNILRAWRQEPDQDSR